MSLGAEFHNGRFVARCGSNNDQDKPPVLLAFRMVQYSMNISLRDRGAASQVSMRSLSVVARVPRGSRNSMMDFTEESIGRPQAFVRSYSAMQCPQLRRVQLFVERTGWQFPPAVSLSIAFPVKSRGRGGPDAWLNHSHQNLSHGLLILTTRAPFRSRATARYRIPWPRPEYCAPAALAHWYYYRPRRSGDVA